MYPLTPKQNPLSNSLPNPQGFPVDALPPLIKDAVQEVQANIKAPLQIIVSSALAAISLACQNSIDVRRPNTRASPCSLFILLIADSGVGKSFADNNLMESIHNLVDSESIISVEKSTEYKELYRLWKIKQRAIESTISKIEKKLLLINQPEQDNELKQRLEILHQKSKENSLSEPTKPRTVKLIYKYTGPQALKLGLSEWPSAGIMSNEAGSVFTGATMTDLGLFNQLWDGGSIPVDLVKGSHIAKNARLTISLLVQGDILDNYLKGRGRKARNIGLLARFLVTSAYEAPGEGYLENRALSWQHLPEFQKRITKILKQNISDVEHGITKRLILDFSEEAKTRWTEVYNAAKADRQQWGFLFDIKDYAAKYAENLARVAALFHFFGEKDGDISLETLERAISVCSWYMLEFKRQFSPPQLIQTEQSDAQQLELWILGKLFLNGFDTAIRKNFIRQYRSCLRNHSNRFDAALDWLHQQRRIICFQVRFTGETGKTDTTWVVSLNPGYFNYLFNSMTHAKQTEVRLPPPTENPCVMTTSNLIPVPPKW